MRPIDYVLWVGLPYVAIISMIAGLIVRFRTDKYGWTTRSSQTLESKQLRFGGPAFHIGLLFVFGGHVIGLLIPKAWTNALRIREEAYHVGSTVMGTAAACILIAGLVVLIIRRVTNKRVWSATTGNDKLTYVVLTAVISAGTFATVGTQIFGGHSGYDYRETISPWIRSIFFLQPQPSLMVDVPMAFKVHITIALLLFTIYPATRLVHAFSAPVGYATRPWTVMRARSARVGVKDPRGWTPINRIAPTPESLKE